MSGELRVGMRPLSKPHAEVERTYPYAVIRRLHVPYYQRDERKVWLYSSLPNSKWASADYIRRILDSDERDYAVRFYRFKDQREALMFEIRWPND